jgi:hypothetical protein
MHALKSMVKTNHEFDTMVEKNLILNFDNHFYDYLGTRFKITITSTLFF